MDEKTTQSRPVEPVTVALIGTGDGSKLASGTMAETPGEHQPNVVVKVITPLLALTVRFANVFLAQFSGLLVAGLTGPGGQLLNPNAQDFAHLIVVCATLSLPGAALSLVKDLVTIFGRLEQKYPLLTGSV